MHNRRYKHRLARLGGAVFSLVSLLVLVGAVLVLLPNTPLSPLWNPTVPLQVNGPVTVMTQFKLASALRTGPACKEALSQAASFAAKPDFEESQQCHIRDQVVLRKVAQAQLFDVATRCQTALRTAMWMQHGVQPAAEKHFGQRVVRLHHLSSFNCRTIRTGRGPSSRMSTHASADAIDITAFTLGNGRKISLLADWNGSSEPTRAFLREIRDNACIWFRTTLSPDYNRLHANHFHLQHVGRGTCR